MKILHAIHAFLPRHRSGSEIYAYDLCRQLRILGHQPQVLCAEYDWSRPHGSLRRRSYDELPVTEITNNWFFSSLEETYGSLEINRQLGHVLEAVQPDVLHIHNLLNLSMDLPSIAASMGIPSVATLHDFTLVCPSGGQRVHLAEEHVCIEIDPARCARCFRESPFHALMRSGQIGRKTRGAGLAGRLATRLRRWFPSGSKRLGSAAAQLSTGPALGAADVSKRLNKARQVYEDVELFVAPSAALAADYRRFGLPAEKIEVSDYGSARLSPGPRAPRGERLRIGFVGTVTWHKGVHVLVEAVRQLPPNRYELLIFGRLEASPEYAREVQEAARGLPVHFKGAFDGAAAASVYAQMDVLVVPSLWPENSPLVIHEAFMATVPVVGARMGGIVDLVRDGESGLLYDAFRPEKLAECLRSLLEDPRRLEAFAGRLPAVKSMERDAAQWEERYRKVLARRGARSDLNAGNRGPSAGP